MDVCGSICHHGSIRMHTDARSMHLQGVFIDLFLLGLIDFRKIPATWAWALEQPVAAFVAGVLAVSDDAVRQSAICSIGRLQTAG